MRLVVLFFKLFNPCSVNFGWMVLSALRNIYHVSALPHMRINRAYEHSAYKGVRGSNLRYGENYRSPSFVKFPTVEFTAYRICDNCYGS